MLRRAGLSLGGHAHDTMIVARVLDSTLHQGQFSLDACAARLGYKKLDTVKQYLLANKLYTVEKSDGKKTSKKNLHFALAPFDMIVPYGCLDAEITYQLGAAQRRELSEVAASMPRGLPNVENVYQNECELVRTVGAMEARGVQIDRDFCRRAIASLGADRAAAVGLFEATTGEPYSDSPLTLKKVFKDEVWAYNAPTKTGKRNPSFDSEVLETFKSPAARAILSIRKAKSDADYFHGFLDAATPAGVIHASFNQHVAATGRFSSSNPNLQNLTKNEESELAQEFVVRRAIVPRPGMVFHMLDYDQVEFRLMLDYAARFAVDNDGVLALIAKVLGGLDVHQATAEVAGVSRRTAKTVNFLTIYGGGVATLAARLGTSESEAGRIRDSVFRGAPEILLFVRRVTDAAKTRGFVVNWFGRKCSFPDSNTSYRAANHVIQGGCADVIKLAMNRIAAYLRDFATELVLTVHDELVLEGPPAEAAEVIPAVQLIMEQAYPSRFLPLTCGVDHSFISLADKTKGIARCANTSSKSFASPTTAPIATRRA